MANFVENKIEYNVKRNPEYFQNALKKGKTLNGNYLRVLPNVTKETLVKKVVSTGTVAMVDGRDCSWDPVQRTEIDSKLMSVENFKVNVEQCLEDLDSIYSEEVYNSIGANKTSMPEGLESVLMNVIQTSLSNDIEKIIWGGTGNIVDGYQNGLVDKLLVDADSIKVTGVNLSTANVIGEIQKVYEAIPNQALAEGEYDPERAKVSIFVSFNTMKYLRQALSTSPTQYQVILPSFTYVDGRIEYMGVEIVAVGLPEDTMVAGSRDNMVFLTDLLSDTMAIKASTGDSIKDEDVWYAKGKFRANADVIFSDEMVIYSV